MSENNLNSIMPLVTVVTVVRNAVEHMERCILSVLNQSYPNVEHVIIDGLSTDGTIDILEKYSDKLGYWVSEKDNGIYDAMNKGVKNAKGDWLIFLGADDYLMGGFTEMAYDLKYPNAIYYGCCLWGNQILNMQPYTEKIIPYECICHQGIFYPKSVFEKYLYNEKYVASADYYLNIQCWTDRSFAKLYVPIMIANFSKGGFSEQYVDHVFQADFQAILKKHFHWKKYFKYRINEFKKEFKKRK